MFVSVRGQEIVVGNDSVHAANKFRVTFHASGQRNLHTGLDPQTPRGRTDTALDTPLRSIRGAEDLYQTTTATDGWGYNFKDDSDKKKTLILDDVYYPDGACVQAWAVEPQRLDVLDQLRRALPFRPLDVVVGDQLTCAWTNPVLLILALRMKPEAVAKLRHALEADGGDPNERLHGFVIGPPRTARP